MRSTGITTPATAAHRITAAPVRQHAQLAAAYHARLTAGHVRLYVGVCDGTIIYRVSARADRVWDWLCVLYCPRRGLVLDCPCLEFQARGVCAHAGAVLERREWEARMQQH